MKAKPILLVFITLIIGFVLGMLTSAQIRNHKLKPVRVFFSEERFREGLYRTIQPDEQQKVKIEQILDKYAKINSELQSNFREEFDSNMKAFRKEIDTNLSDEQRARLKEMDEKRQEMIRQNRMNHRNDSFNSGNGQNHPPYRPFHEGIPPPGQKRDSTSLPDNK
jgi:AraC-like DNA-binding protein